MKSKCSFILKAGLSLVLALVLLFGTVATSFAVAVDDSSAAQPAKEQAEKPAEEPAVYSNFVASTGETLAAAAEAADAADEVDDVVLPSLKKVVDLADTGLNYYVPGKSIVVEQASWFSNDSAVPWGRFTGGTGGTIDVKGTQITGNYYKIVVPSGNKTSLVIYRGNSSGIQTSWGGNFTADTSHNAYYTNGGSHTSFNAFIAGDTVYIDCTSNTTWETGAVYVAGTNSNNDYASFAKATKIAEHLYKYTIPDDQVWTTGVLYTWRAKATMSSSSDAWNVSNALNASDYFTNTANSIYWTSNDQYSDTGSTGMITLNSITKPSLTGDSVITNGSTAAVTVSNAASLKLNYTRAGSNKSTNLLSTDKKYTYYLDDTLKTSNSSSANYTYAAADLTAGEHTAYVKINSALTGLNNTSSNFTILSTTPKNITYRAKYSDDGSTWNDLTASQGSFSVTNNDDGESIGAANTAHTLDYNTELTLTATRAGDYAVEGIYWSTNNGSTWTKVDTADTKVNSTYNKLVTAMTNDEFRVTDNFLIEARFVKVYKLTAFDSYEQVNGAVLFITAPPKTVSVKHTNAAGTESTLEYSYSGTATKGNPDTGSDEASAGSPSNASGILYGGGNYGAGNYIQILAGDEVTLKYSAMASSELIRGVFYNNAIQYATSKPSPDAFVQHDFSVDKTLYANHTYYDNASVVSTITANESSYRLHDSDIDQNQHCVTISAMTSDLKNIDIELAPKRKIFFSDTTNAVINSKNIDDYYYNGEALCGDTEAEYLTVKAAGNANQTNTIDIANIHIYEADADGKPVEGAADLKSSYTIAYSSGSSAISNSGATASTVYITINGTMPNHNLYIDLGVSSKYTIKLGTRIISDLNGSYTRLRSVASSITCTGGAATLTANTGSDVTSSTTVTVGDPLTFTVDTLNTSYMFVGFYWGSDTEPNYETGFINAGTTTDTTTILSYTPKTSGTIWAVGTHDLFINGSQYITGKTYSSGVNWNQNGSGTWQNLQMSFDPDKGTKGMYYWEITETMFSTAGEFKTWQDGSDGNPSSGYGSYHAYSSNFYWNSNNDTTHGKAYFQFLDSATGYNNKTVWTGINSFKEDNPADGPTYGKIYPTDSSATPQKDGQGFINFIKANYPGYDAPLRIYYDPAGTTDKTKLIVEATPIYSDLFVSNGFDVGSTSKDTRVDVQPVKNGAIATGADAFTISSGTTFTETGTIHEGTVTHYKPQQKDATVRITKTVGGSSGKYDKVEGFFIYNIDTKKARTETDVKVSGQDYYIDLKLKTPRQRLYIVPIIEEYGADVTITFDATQLNRKQWGDIVSAFAWYDSGYALGDYPGQPMVCSDDMTTWTAKFKSTKSSQPLQGITFANYIDGTHTWFGRTGSNSGTYANKPVMSTVTYGGNGKLGSPRTVTNDKNGIFDQYNYIQSGDYNEYSRMNFKAQTYDYREPIAMYNRMVNSSQKEYNISFSMKDGDSSLISWKHTDLMYKTPATGTGANGAYLPADGTVKQNILNTTWPLNWEYLTNAKGDKYVDMNGDPMLDKPSPTFYVAAKGGVIYGGSELKTVFHSGKNGRQYQQQGTPSGTDTDTKNKKDLRWTETVTYGGASGVNMNYGVQWYVYDASGNYITTVLSAGIADSGDTNNISYIAQQLTNMGYAVTGKSVAICYDKPRYMYWDNEKASSGALAYPLGTVTENGTTYTKKINTGDGSEDPTVVGNGFDVYRFTGQWHVASQNDTVRVHVGVGMMTASGEVLAESNSAGYGNATAIYDVSKGNTGAYGGNRVDANGDLLTHTGSNKEYVQTAVGDASNNPVKLTASATNFIGWYYYDANTNEFLKADYESNENFYPNYANKDVTYYAMYRASAVYQYTYTGREGTRHYGATGDDLTSAELSNNNRIDHTSHTADITSKLPVGIGVFKKTIDFSADNYGSWRKTPDSKGYILDISGFTSTNQTYILTAHYKNAAGQLVTVSDTAEYNEEAVDLTVGSYKDSKGTTKPANTDVTSYYGTGAHRFLGWYAYDSGTPGDLLSTQHNYGLRLTRNQDIIALYAEGGNALPTDGWQVKIDENEFNKELTSSTTGFYYNDTIVRVRNGSDVRATLPEGAKIGVLVVCDNKTNNTINGYSTEQLTTLVGSIDSGQTKKTRTGLSITNMQATTQTTFNRTDIAVRAAYEKVYGAKYCVYAYFYDGSGYHFSAASDVKTYN